MAKTFILKQPLVFPAGSIFGSGPEKTVNAEIPVELIFGLTSDTSGRVTYYIDAMTPEEFDAWFEVVE